MDERARWQTLAWAAAAVLVVFLGARQFFSRHEPGEGAAPPVAVRGGDRPARGGGEEPRSAGVFVHVAGAVRRPGLYRVAAGARVAVAVRHAGGFTGRADPVAVNLAAKLQDGQQVVVPVRGAAPVAGDAGSGGSAAVGAGAAAGRKLSLATATEEQLDGLDGIGPALAKRIIEYRTAHGGFRSVEELQEVGGIGPKRFEALKDAVGP